MVVMFCDRGHFPKPGNDPGSFSYLKNERGIFLSGSLYFIIDLWLVSVSVKHESQGGLVHSVTHLLCRPVLGFEYRDSHCLYN